MSHIAAAKKIAKSYGVKGFRKVNLKRVKTLYNVGKQCQQIDAETALAFIADLEAAGVEVMQRDTILSLASRGHMDMITIR